MNLSDFDYNLPLELIAQNPKKKRDSSRLLVLNKLTGEISHRHFFDIVEYLQVGDVLVLNDSKVFPARLFGNKKASGGKVEILLNKELSVGVWEVLGRNVKVGDKIEFEKSKLFAEVMRKYDEVCEVKFNLYGQEFFEEVGKMGHTPLPPYIKRDDNKVDKQEYQTVYAKNFGSAAAPTAGLHFTEELLKKIEDKGINIAKVTLNVGLGTFAPVKTDKIEDHKIHSEYFSVEKEQFKKIVEAMKEGRRIIAVGTTSTRVLETVFSDDRSTINNQPLANISGWTEIFIYPGYKFRCIDGLITNFHLPKSTLLMLVSALAGKENTDAAYKEAIKEQYQFFSYGDAMLII